MHVPLFCTIKYNECHVKSSQHVDPGVCLLCMSVEAPPSLLLTSGGLIHQSLDCDTHLQKAFLFQDVVRKTQFVLGEQNARSKKKEKKGK